MTNLELIITIRCDFEELLKKNSWLIISADVINVSADVINVSAGIALVSTVKYLFNIIFINGKKKNKEL